MGMTAAEKQAAYRARKKQVMAKQTMCRDVAYNKAMALAEENKRLRARIAELEEELRGNVTMAADVGNVTEPEEPEPEERVEEGNGNPMGGHWSDFGDYIVP